MAVTSISRDRQNIQYYEERVDMACAFRWAVRYNMHEAVANHFSLAVDEGGTKFLMNPNQRHFSRIRASDFILIDANDPTTMDTEDAPDPTAWGLHGSIHRHCPHARCVMHVHSTHATVLASLADSRLPAIDQNTAMFYDRIVIDEHYGGLAMEEEGTRCAQLFQDPKYKTMIMGNHGVLVIGDSVADAFNRLFYLERAAETYIRALQTGQPLRYLPDDIASKTAQEIESYPKQASCHMDELKAILDSESSDYRD